jgi:isopentenyl diphosphate isomerase/L-lactate dehydrogenase-like FMN-dependent dehydrogenase
MVVAKGVMCYDDAVLAIENGADGIFVSNHGARQLDTTPATIDVLPEIVAAVKNSARKVPIFFDGGIRKGSDAFKAIALGADVVFIGRPVLWGLAVGGQQGVEKVIELMNEELKQCMLTTGCMNINDVRGNTNLIYDKTEHIFKL